MSRDVTMMMQLALAVRMTCTCDQDAVDETDLLVLSGFKRFQTVHEIQVSRFNLPLRNAGAALSRDKREAERDAKSRR